MAWLLGLFPALAHADADPASDILLGDPAGFGLAHAGSRSALAGLAPNGLGKSNGLTQTAILAVQRIARGAGKPIGSGPQSAPASSSHGGTSPLITFSAPALLVLIGAAVAARFHRHADRGS
jgi:hypothetical protein